MKSRNEFRELINKKYEQHKIEKRQRKQLFYKIVPSAACVVLFTVILFRSNIFNINDPEPENYVDYANSSADVSFMQETTGSSEKPDKSSKPHESSEQYIPESSLGGEGADFEDLILSSTDIITAKYKESYKENGYIVRRFCVEEIIFGGNSTSDILVYFYTGEEAESEETKDQYEENAVYLLIFEALDSDSGFIQLGNAYIPLDDLENSKLYGESIEKYSSGGIFTQGSDKKKLTDYIHDILESQ